MLVQLIWWNMYYLRVSGAAVLLIVLFWFAEGATCNALWCHEVSSANSTILGIGVLCRVTFLGYLGDKFSDLINFVFLLLITVGNSVIQIECNTRTTIEDIRLASFNLHEEDKCFCYIGAVSSKKGEILHLNESNHLKDSKNNICKLPVSDWSLTKKKFLHVAFQGGAVNITSGKSPNCFRNPGIKYPHTLTMGKLIMAEFV